ncbi:hypothetical protein, partial [Flammeovirga aprica]
LSLLEEIVQNKYNFPCFNHKRNEEEGSLEVVPYKLAVMSDKLVYKVFPPYSLNQASGIPIIY